MIMKSTSIKIVKHERANAKTEAGWRDRLAGFLIEQNFERRRELHNVTTNDLRHALALLKYLHTCHRATLELPGVKSALKSTPEIGIHCYDRAYCFVNDYLYEAECWLEHRLEELDRPAIRAR
jgi:hypothetical protein